MLPPIARLNRQQAMYYFLSGYTAKLAGTERGITEPQAEFSACFGAPFLPLPPMTYAQPARRAASTSTAPTSGWSTPAGRGGPYGTGAAHEHRPHARHRHARPSTASLAQVETRTDPVSASRCPSRCPGVPAEVLVPRNTWADKDAYDATARNLVERFRANFATFADEVTTR